MTAHRNCEQNIDKTPHRELWPQWRRIAAKPKISQSIRDLYDQLDQEVSQRNPTCWISGRCCNFDQFEHRLYVTGLEIAWVLNQSPLPPEHQIDLQAPCPYQVTKLCSIHGSRPMGCRVFFCQKGTENWQQKLYEQTMNKIRDLHVKHAITYRYLEWRRGLAEALEQV